VRGTEVTIEARRWFGDPRFADTLGRSWELLADGRVLYMQGPEQMTAAWLRVVPRFARQIANTATRER